MLYVYYGSDVKKARAKLQSTTNALRKKNPDAHYVRITADTFADYNLEELTQSQALFKSEYIVVFDTVSMLDEHQEMLLSWLKELADAPHAFFILEEKLLAPARKKLEKHADKFQEFDVGKKTTRDDFNTFALTDAFGARNKKHAWVLLQKARMRGTSPEELHGLLFWIAKSMAVAAQVNTAEEADMKPFVFNKARRFAQNYSNEELRGHVRVLSTLPQHARRSATQLDISLEQFVLAI